MILYYITSLLTTVTALSLGLFVLYKNPKNPIHKALFRLNCVVAFWSFFLFLHYSSTTPASALITSRLLHAACVFIPACYMHFLLNLLGLRKKIVLALSYALGCFFLALNLSPLFIKGVEAKLFFCFYADAGPLYITWIIFYLASAVYGAVLMLKTFKTADSVTKNQIKYVFFASLIGFAGGATIYPLFYDIGIPPFGEHVIFLYPIIFTVAVLIHNLLDLNIVIKRTLVYSASVIIITLLYLITVLVLERFLRDFVGYKSLWVSLASAVVIALLFTPVKNRVQSVADRIYVSGTYRRLQNELAESDKQKAVANFAAGMAHEIRNPLQAIKTFAEYLPGKFDDKEFREDFSKIVGSEVDKINSLISRLLEFSKPSGLSLSETDMHELLDYALGLFSGEMIKSNIRFVKNYCAELPAVSCDSKKLQHAFFNIIKNAIEAMETGGVLTVSTGCTGNKFSISISDTGCGISSRDIDRVFEPFYSTKQKGAGLGLAIVRGIIEEHCGSIRVESTPGIGTTFTVTV